VRRQGIGVSPGLAQGRALVLQPAETPIFRLPIDTTAVAGEISRLQEARAEARRQIMGIRDRIAAAVGEAYARVFEAHLLILDDRQLHEEPARIIREEKVNAEWALSSVTERLLAAFERIPDPYLRERSGDLEDVARRLQQILAGESRRHDLSELEEDAVVVAHSLSPSDAALLHHPHVVAFVTDLGGRTSHTAILANALDLPAVVGLHDFSALVKEGDLLLVDGAQGEILVNPTATEESHWKETRRARLEREAQLQSERDLPATTQDGVEIEILANIEFPREIPRAIAQGARGIGLYRSEFLFLAHSPALPDEDDHRTTYEEIARAAGSRTAIIRTLDLGGDKYFHEVLDRNEANPVMGLRAIRFCLKRPDIFRTQLRGLLRASIAGTLRVMFPLVSGGGELRAARALLDEVRAGLEAEGVPTGPLPVGIMVEVPSAALIADRLAREVEFFSIGTNDLLQYSLALDRGNESLAGLYQPFHPALLRLIHGIVQAADAAGIEVSLCGEMASDPLAIPVLVGLGLRRLSANPVAIPEVRATVRRLHAGRAAALAEDVLSLATAEEIEERVRAAFPPEPPAETGARALEETE